MANETPSNAALSMDRGLPLGNSEDADLRRALHVKVRNKATEPIPVDIVDSFVSATVSTYGEALAVPSGVQTTIVSYTVPVAQTLFLERVEVSGTNIAEYFVFIDAAVEGKKWTWFSDGLSINFEFSSSTSRGRTVTAGQVILIQLLHARPGAGDFSARIQGSLVT